MIQTEAHLAYLVDDVDEAIKGKELVQEPWDANPTTRVGFVLEDGQLVEFLWFRTPEPRAPPPSPPQTNEEHS